jgi:GntR family transcriptional regulator/MocR family aminotransferase
VPAQDQFAPDLLVRLHRDGTPLRVQLERELREGIRAGRLQPGTDLPSSRALAAELGVSRGVIVEAYAQLAAEGWLTSRQGSRTRVAASARRAEAPAHPPAPVWRPRFDFRPGIPDLSAFPRAEWLTSARRGLRDMSDGELAYGDPRGSATLRRALAAYLGRARGVVAVPGQVLICAGVTNGIALVCSLLRRRGGRRVAVEDPGFFIHRLTIEHAGLETVPVPVDGDGLDVARLPGDVDAVLCTPAHQSPMGAVLAPERRAALLAWAEERDALILEDDYDAEYRYDREPVGALQGLAPERVVFLGSASKSLAPALRLGSTPISARRCSTSSRSQTSWSAASSTATSGAPAAATAAGATRSWPRSRGTSPKRGCTAWPPGCTRSCACPATWTRRA